MNTDDDIYIKSVCLAADTNDLVAIEQLLARRDDVNTVNSDGDSLLEAILNSLSDTDAHRYDVVELLLRHGLDPSVLNGDGSPCLCVPMYRMDVRMIALLLEHGVNPNHGCGYDCSETFYDHADFDYRYKTGMLGYHQQPAWSHDEDVNLVLMDRWAMAFGTQRPEHLLLLRSRGALTTCETAVRLGGSRQDPIHWDGEWKLDRRDIATDTGPGTP